MEDNKKFIGSDGRTYDSLSALNKGESHARMERQMAEDIQKQNRLLEKNIQLQEQDMYLQEQKIQVQKEIANKQIQLELQKEQNRINEANRQRKHEKNMRLLNLFDTIGISRDTYYNYINKSMHDTETEKEIANINREIKTLEQLGKYNRYEIDDYLKQNKTEYTEFVSECRDNAIRTKTNKELKPFNDELLKYKNFKRKMFICSGAIFIIAVLFLIISCSTGIELFFLIFDLSVIVSIILLASGIKLHENDICRLENNLNNLETFDINKYRSFFTKKIEELKTEVNNYQNKVIEKIRPHVDDFTNYRKNHYNSKIEKLLIDIGYKNIIINMGLKYEVINNSNKNKDGTIEDYIEYFENHS